MGHTTLQLEGLSYLLQCSAIAIEILQNFYFRTHFISKALWDNGVCTWAERIPQAACLSPHLHTVFNVPHKHRLLRDPWHRQVQQDWKWAQVTLKLSNPRVLTAPVYTFSLNQNMLWTEKKKKKQWDSKRSISNLKNPTVSTHVILLL